MVMKQRAVGLLAIVFLASCAQQQSTQTATPAAPAAASPSAAAAAPGANATPVTPQQWNVATTHCSVLLGAADDDRMAAVMFYYGYLAAKANIKVINTGNIEGNIAKVMDRCVAKPDITIPQAFREALVSKPTAKK